MINFISAFGRLFLGSEGGNSGNSWIIFVLLGAVLVVMLVVSPMMRRKKQNTYVDNLHKGIQVGSTIKTLGGLIGKVVDIKQMDAAQKVIVLETGNEESKSTLTFDIMYVYSVLLNPDGTKYNPPSATSKSTGSTSSTSSVKVVEENDTIQATSDATEVFGENTSENATTDAETSNIDASDNSVAKETVDEFELVTK